VSRIRRWWWWIFTFYILHANSPCSRFPAHVQQRIFYGLSKPGSCALLKPVRSIPDGSLPAYIAPLLPILLPPPLELNEGERADEGRLSSYGLFNTGKVPPLPRHFSALSASGGRLGVMLEGKQGNPSSDLQFLSRLIH